MKQKINRFCAMLLMPFMLVLNCPVTAIGADPEVPAIGIEITHDPVEKTTAGQRIAMEVEVEDESGVEVVRVYFKAVEAMDYVFVPMEATEDKNTYKGTLPAPANGAEGIDYLILVKNGYNQVVKTQTYRIAVEDDDDAAEAVTSNEQIDVFTELQEAPTEVSGFSDNIVVDVVESGAKLGVVAGIYSATVTGGSTSSAVGAGTVAASTGGISTTALVIGAVAAVAVVGGAAAASGGGGSSGGGSGGSGGDELTPQTILGAWSVSGSSTSGRTTSGAITFQEGGGYSYSLNTPGTGVQTGTGSYTLTGTNLVMRFDAGAVYNGTVSGNSRNFTMRSTNGWVLNYSR